MSATTLFNYEQHFLSESLEQLQDYLLSGELFWQLNLRSLHGAAPYPQLTLGNLLLSRARLEGLKKGGQLSSQQEKELNGLTAKAEEIHGEWRSAWEKKAEKEFRSRLRQWERYLDEMGENPERHAAYYATEVRVRTILGLLAGQLPDAETVWKSELGRQDQRLKRMTAKGGFVWQPESKGAFPKERFWFLYVWPKGI